MLFNSLEFLVLFTLVFGLYVALPHVWIQNAVLLVASLVFYGWWDVRFLGLLLLTSLVDFYVAQALARTDDPKKRKRLILVSLISNLSVLGFFKYFNFFTETFAFACKKLGVEVSPVTLRIVLPVGISFYTFQALAYTIDVYRKQIRPIRNLPLFLTFVSYFPQLVAGPIQRATRLIPQLAGARLMTWTMLRDGAWLILFGLFKKIVVADNLAALVDPVFSANASTSGLYTLLSIYAFAFQIYCDFSGYTDIARGVSKWLGIELMVNFRRPYFAQDPSDFWQRWHISLSEWLRDYLYISLGGNRHGEWKTYRNLMITMLLGGLWHGATWMFVLWGAFHGAWLVVHRLYRKFLGPLADALDYVPFARVIRTLVCFHFVCISWVLFRADTVPIAVHVWELLFGSYTLGSDETRALIEIALCVTPLLAIDLLAEPFDDDVRFSHGTVFLQRVPAPVRGFMVAFLLFALSVAGAPSGREFIYFQF